MLAAKDLAAIESSVTWGHPNELGVTNWQARRLVDEIRRLERDNMALRDGLRGWQETAKEVGARLSTEAEWQNLIVEVSAIVDEFDPTICGTLAERVRKALRRFKCTVCGGCGSVSVPGELHDVACSNCE